MVWIPGGEFSMGCELPADRAGCAGDVEADSRPVHRVAVAPFWIDATLVTNAQFAAFVAATGHVTVAERTPSRSQFPDAEPEQLVAGSLVFTPPKRAVALDDPTAWWRYVPGASWRHPEGPDSTIVGHDDRPVVQVAFEDALAFATWSGKRLPTEAEFEFAARGGLAGCEFAWGDELHPDGRWMANTWQGDFPLHDDGTDGFVGTSPVRSFPPNGYGLFDMAGNVWEWCSDWYRADAYAELAARGGVARDPTGPAQPLDPLEPTQRKHVQRGGSFLCCDQYCGRHRVGARGRGEETTSTDHVGFRCVRAPSRDR
jgi:formylglycine-generating enzyme required for sulfatase activity